MSRENTTRDNGPGPTSVSTVGSAAEQQIPIVILSVCFKRPPVKSLQVIDEGQTGGQMEVETIPVYKHFPTIQLKCYHPCGELEWKHTNLRFLSNSRSTPCAVAAFIHLTFQCDWELSDWLRNTGISVTSLDLLIWLVATLNCLSVLQKHSNFKVTHTGNKKRTHIWTNTHAA